MQRTLNVPTDLDTKQVAIWSMDTTLLQSRQPAIYGLATIAYVSCGEVYKIVKESPTYPDLLSIANELILRSGDRHHVFIESFEYNEETDQWMLYTGS